MIRAAIAAGIGAALVWNIQSLSGLEHTLVELIIAGRIPFTDVYLNFLATLPILVVLTGLLLFWTRQLFTDFLDYSLDFQKAECAKQLAHEPIIDEEPINNATGDLLGEDELDLLSV